MSRSPPNDVRVNALLTIECLSLEDDADINSLSLLKNNTLIRQQTSEPFQIVYQTTVKDISPINFECVLVSRHYPELRQSRLVEVICE